MHLINIFNDIQNDFQKEQYSSSSVLSRRFELHNRIVILASVYKNSFLCEVGYLLSQEFSLDILKDLPNWKGMEQRVSKIMDNGKTAQFIIFKQLDCYEHKIFALVMQNIIDEIEKLESVVNIINSIKETLIKWSTFFQFEKEYVLSENKQQGLYGELHFMEKMIGLYGEKIINCWTGCNAEEHDFYVDTNAIEVKSSSAKGPDKIKISNEYQLDDAGIMGRLYLLFLKLKKSEKDGESLPEIVERIFSLLSVSNKEIFNNKLLKVGYIYKMPELYTICFKLRDESCYEVVPEFPKITTKTISKGIGCVDYTVSLDACSQFQITIESFYKGVKNFDY